MNEQTFHVDRKCDKSWGNGSFQMDDGNKIRQMFASVAECASNVLKHSMENVGNGEKSILK